MSCTPSYYWLVEKIKKIYCAYTLKKGIASETRCYYERHLLQNETKIYALFKRYIINILGYLYNYFITAVRQFLVGIAALSLRVCLLSIWYGLCYNIVCLIFIMIKLNCTTWGKTALISWRPKIINIPQCSIYLLKNLL